MKGPRLCTRVWALCYVTMMGMDRWLDESDAKVFVTVGEARNPGGTQRLMEYWTHGPGAAKIRWGTDHAFDRCVHQLRKYAVKGHFDVHGLCARLHKRATGEWPTEHGEHGIPS